MLNFKSWKGAEDINGTILITVAILLLIVLRIIYEVKHFRVKKYVIMDNRLKEDIKILFLSDLHNCKYGNKNVKLVERIKKINPQAVFIGGDLINGMDKLNSARCYGNAISFLEGITKDFPVYYAFGNHELYLRATCLYDEYISKITSIENLFLINNKNVQLKNLIIHGMELPISSYKRRKGTYEFSEVNFRKIFGEKNESLYEILLVHKPEYFEDYSRSNIDLVLAGHNHGGTIRLPIVRGIISRDFKILPKYSYGMYKSKNNSTKMILTSGLGDHTIHFRLFNMPEMVEISLKRG